MTALEVRRSRDRGYADHGWLKTYYTFSFADYYDPEHLDFGPLQVMNEDRLKPGKGYAEQERRDVEVLTYLIGGELEHKDSLGNETVVRAGSLQCMSAGIGLTHTEFNRSAAREAHLLHICMNPSSVGTTPTYAQKHFPPEEKRGTLRLIASADGESGSVVIHQDARLYAGLFHEAQRTELELAKNRRAFLHVLRGSIALNETRLNAGDGVKISPPGEVILQHGRDADVILFDLPGGAAPARRKKSSANSGAQRPGR
jgi:redox-sensitive bicupin YhaK (pirin superfamily)